MGITMHSRFPTRGEPDRPRSELRADVAYGGTDDPVTKSRRDAGGRRVGAVAGSGRRVPELFLDR
ncbi:hypothetical protein ACIO93_02580 [Streptomyces sp. NPDC087903]|uniref:hypothetical protein n=1 Tax=Streptomyces sp. NPDC087903 TaxID=3365819 RepID=UPI003812E92A